MIQPCFVLRNLQFKQEGKFSFITNFKVVSSSLIDWLIDSAFCSQRRKKCPREVACLKKQKAVLWISFKFSVIIHYLEACFKASLQLFYMLSFLMMSMIIL